MKVFSIVIRCIMIALFLFFALGWWPTLSSVLFLLAAVLVLPIKPFDEALAKIKIKPLLRGIIAFVIFVIGLTLTPEMAPSTAARLEREGAAAQESAKEEDDEDDDEEYEEEDDDLPDTLEDHERFDTMEETIIGTWVYDDPDMSVAYDFFDDGTWSMSSEDEILDQGTYEIVNDVKVVMTGEYDDYELTIFDMYVLYDEEGRELGPYYP